MAPFAKLIATSLFAASAPPESRSRVLSSRTITSNSETTSGPTTISSKSTITTASKTKRTVSDIVNEFKEKYRYLDGETCMIRSLEYSPTVRFTHVLPPSSAPIVFEENANQTQKELRQEQIEKVAASHNHTKKVAIYLPGLDGTGISCFQQFPDLANEFELWRLSVAPNDKTSFVDLSTHICHFIDDLVNLSSSSFDPREVVLIGESFGGLLAPAVAMRRSEEQGLKALVLVNPATSFEETQWSAASPFITSFAKGREHNKKKNANGTEGGNSNRDGPTSYSVAGAMALAATVPDQTQYNQILDMMFSVPVENAQDLQNVWTGMTEAFNLLETYLPADTLDHRIEQWCIVGCQVVKPRLERIQQKTLIVAGKQDNMLPTKDEANVLAKRIPNATKVEFSDSGHYLLDSRVNITEFILDAKLFPTKKDDKKYDPIVDWKPPLPSIYKKKIEEQVKPLRQLTGPVFLSTNQDGKRYMGLGQLPSRIISQSDDSSTNRPMLIVANHQLIGLDLSLIVSELFEQRGIWARGLAHPIIFAGAQLAQEGGGGGGKSPGDNGMGGATEFEKYGAVVVTPRNYYRLMQTGQTALLFPGGVREVFHGKDEAYQLFWPEGEDGNKVDFVRTAARFNATVVTLSAIGAADSLNVLVDAPDLLNLPFGLGERVANASRSIMPARYDAPDNEGELFAAPLVAPGKPDRHYFVFGKPFDMSDVDPTNKVQCRERYQAIKAELERGFDDLLMAREHDPYRDITKRIPYEAAFKKPAPTFPIDVFDKEKTK